MSDTCKTQIGKLLPQLRELLDSNEYAKIETMDSQTTRKYMNKLAAEQPTLSTERDKLELEHTESIKKATTTKSKHDNAVEQRTSFQKQLDEINKYLEGKGERPTIECDKCGSILTPDQWTKHIDETREKHDQLETEINQLQGQFSSETQLSEGLHKKLEEAKTKFDNQGKAIGILEQLATQREEMEKATSSQEQILEQEKSVILEFRRAALHRPSRTRR